MILDSRGREDSIEQLVEELKKEIVSLGADVTTAENLGLRDFARVTDPKFTAGTYVEFIAGAAAGFAAQVQEHFRLNKAVYRLFVEQA